MQFRLCRMYDLQGCNLAHVLGLYKMTGLPGGAFSLTARGSVADVALWAIARLQTRVFASTWVPAPTCLLILGLLPGDCIAAHS